MKSIDKNESYKLGLDINTNTTHTQKKREELLNTN